MEADERAAVNARARRTYKNRIEKYREYNRKWMREWRAKKKEIGNEKWLALEKEDKEWTQNHDTKKTT